MYIIIINFVILFISINYYQIKSQAISIVKSFYDVVKRNNKLHMIWDIFDVIIFVYVNVDDVWKTLDDQKEN